ncbi:MAG TPA: prepilin-type N-terminal cleavage/methylation domain-containing protein [Candidatus Binatia bacterium]|nr:prepilin-type N-terminal cleavage/methylation domain-containing protein [Candidatus Binatia bacterium]
MKINTIKLNRSARPTSRRGFTLVEVVCATAIAAIMVSVLFHGFDNGFAILRATRDNLRATQILMQKTEAFRLYTWAQLSNCPSSFQEYYNPLGVTNNNAGTLFYGTLSTTAAATNIPVSAGYRTNLHLSTITIKWTNAWGAHSLQMQTLSAKNGMQNYLAK